MFRLIFFIILLPGLMVAVFPMMQSQTITGISTIWDDDFREWSIFTEEDTINFGTLELVSMMGSPRLDWSYRVVDQDGRIRNIDRNVFSAWEVQGPGNIATVRQLWRDDLREWRVTDNRKSVVWRSRYANHYEEWVITSRDYGYFTMYTLNPGDPRDWVVVDTLHSDFPFEMKMAFVFITVFLTAPF